MPGTYQLFSRNGNVSDPIFTFPNALVSQIFTQQILLRTPMPGLLLDSEAATINNSQIGTSPDLEESTFKGRGKGRELTSKQMNGEQVPIMVSDTQMIRGVKVCMGNGIGNFGQGGQEGPV